MILVLFVVSNIRNALERFLDYARNDCWGMLSRHDMLDFSTTLEMTVGGCLVAWRIVIPSVAEGSRELSPRAALSRHDMLDFSTTLEMTVEGCLAETTGGYLSCRPQWRHLVPLMPRTLSRIGC